MVLSEVSGKSLVLNINTFCYSFTWVLSLQKITHLFNQYVYVHTYTLLHGHFFNRDNTGRKLFILRLQNIVNEHFTGKYQQQTLCVKYDIKWEWVKCKINSCWLSTWNKGYLIHSGSELWTSILAWGSVPRKLLIPQLITKFPIIYVIIGKSTIAHLWTLFCATWIQSASTSSCLLLQDVCENPFHLSHVWSKINGYDIIFCNI
jgi:hypothetical protein